MDEMRDIGPVGFISLADLDRRPEAFRLHRKPDFTDLVRG